MPDFFISSPDQTIINLIDTTTDKRVAIDIVDIIDRLNSSRKLSEEGFGDVSNWFNYFQGSLENEWGVKISKTEAVLLVQQANSMFERLKKNGLQGQEPVVESTTPQS